MSKSRTDRYVDWFFENLRAAGMDREEAMSDYPGDEERYVEEMIDPEGRVRKDDEQLWALYREVADSQREAVELLNPSVEISQSTASRTISDMDTEIFTAPILSIQKDLEKAEFVEPYPDEWAEAYRSVVSRAIADVLALEAIATASEQTPEWALERFPELQGSGYQFGMALANKSGYSFPESDIVSQPPQHARKR